MTLTYTELSKLARRMKALQDDTAPLTPTVRQVAAAWGISSTGHARHLLDRLLHEGFVERIWRGKKSYWRAK